MRPDPKNWWRSYGDASNRADKRTGNGRGSFGVDRAAPVPPRAFVPITQSFTEKYALQKQIMRVGQTGVELLEPVERNAFIYTPSDRLTLTLQVFFEADVEVGADAAFLSPIPEWTITRMAINSISGRESAMSQFYPDTGAAALPDEVITESAPELLRANLSFSSLIFTDDYAAAFATAGATSLTMVLQAKWEPEVQTIPPEELKRLYDRCRIAYGPPVEVAFLP